MTPTTRQRIAAVLTRYNSELMARDLAEWYGVSLDEVNAMATNGGTTIETNATWTTAMGEQVRVSYRGPMNGLAVIWTGRMQLSVPAESVKID